MKIMSYATEILDKLAFELDSEKNHFKNNPVKDNILPPYLGEMGLEVNYFLPAIEPWLRSGWKIYAKRPELYPKGTALFETEFFDDINRLIEKYKTRPIMCRQVMPMAKPDGIRVNRTADALQLIIDIRQQGFYTYHQKRQFEKELKKIVGNKVLHENRPSTPWDEYLTSVHNSFTDPALSVCSQAITPSYLPYDFTEGDNILPEHIGVQLRRLFPHDERDSDIDRVVKAVHEASNILKLPVLMYGEPKGTTSIPDYPLTAQFVKGGGSLLKTELMALRTCRLMFAPCSGWCNLMAWLKIPTFVEKFALSITNSIIFNPQIVELPDNNLQEHLFFLLSRRGMIKETVDQEVHPLYKHPGYQNTAFL
jgi:hypothetical protein